MTFDLWKEPIKVYNATSMDTFKYRLKPYIALAENIERPDWLSGYSRLLRYDTKTDTYYYKKERSIGVKIQISQATKVIAFDVYGTTHIALIKHKIGMYSILSL